MATAPAQSVIFQGSGWGALENLRREKAGERRMAPHLDFGECGEDRAWISLLENSYMPEPE